MKVKDRELWNDVQAILKNNMNARKDNRVLLKEYYKSKHMTLDEAFGSSSVPNYQSVERIARRLKATMHELRVDKTDEIDKYMDIAMTIPEASDGNR